jgi:hypothetical protein
MTLTDDFLLRPHPPVKVLSGIAKVDGVVIQRFGHFFPGPVFGGQLRFVVHVFSLIQQVHFVFPLDGAKRRIVADKEFDQIVDFICGEYPSAGSLTNVRQSTDLQNNLGLSRI